MRQRLAYRFSKIKPVALGLKNVLDHSREPPAKSPAELPTYQAAPRLGRHGILDAFMRALGFPAVPGVPALPSFPFVRGVPGR
jgi:hypothetical protein